ncbi:MAG TPA: NUDIX hydrolase [Candidatus Limnocylindria bacterium]|nr:NUDIX hydrolase [Candidatus Limnocylindria bacterium]
MKMNANAARPRAIRGIIAYRRGLYLTAERLADAARRWGEPRRISLELAIGERERDLVRGSRRDQRSHDVTLFIERAGLWAVIAKPQFPPGVWRAPSGGVHVDEDLEAGALREALEETGLTVALQRYLLHIDARFAYRDEIEPWHSEVFLAPAVAGEIAPIDTHEISGARWMSRDELLGPVRERLLSSGRGLFAYRAALHDAAFEQLDRMR